MPLTEPDSRREPDRCPSQGRRHGTRLDLPSKSAAPAPFRSSRLFPRSTHKDRRAPPRAFPNAAARVVAAREHRAPLVETTMRLGAYSWKTVSNSLMASQVRHGVGSGFVPEISHGRQSNLRPMFYLDRLCPVFSWRLSGVHRGASQRSL